MSRTYRNRRSVPKDWTVRDTGIPYYKGGDPWGNNLRALGSGYYRPMPRYRRWWGSKESKTYRNLHGRSYRAKVQGCIRNARYDSIPRFRRTSGWLTR